MSDPGITYRSRDEVSKVRATKDPIESLKVRIMESSFATEQELKEIEKEVRAEVNQALKMAKGGMVPARDELFKDMFSTGKILPDGLHESEFPDEVRMPDPATTKVFAKPSCC
jgi:pyruvate dehydrogenase E1 component alpha subunit